MDPITQQGIAGAAGAGGDKIYVDDVFNTYLYDGNGSGITFNNGIDLAGEGGLVWLKQRSGTAKHQLYDTNRGTQKLLCTNDNAAEVPTTGYGLQSFNSNGFSIGANWHGENSAGQGHVAWTFRKAPGFFDVVTWTGDGNNQQHISHNLGCVPGFIMVKRYSATEDWTCYHRSLGNNAMIQLNSSGAEQSGVAFWNNTDPTSTRFTVGSHDRVNTNGQNYVAYVFAHDDQSFGQNGDEGAVYCGTFNGGGTYQNNIIHVNCGFEAQWVMWKQKNSGGAWYMMDTTRKMTDDGYNSAALYANAISDEGNPVRFWADENGFAFDEDLGGTSAQYIFIAIARPNKPPETGAEVFDVGTRSGSSNDTLTNSSIFTDMTFVMRTDSSTEYYGIASRKSGQYHLQTNNTNSYSSGWMDSTKPWANMTGVMMNGANGAGNTGSLVDFSFKRAPGFFDVVTYNGTGSLTNIPHNLRAVPQMMWIKNGVAGYNWVTYNSVSGASKIMYLDGASTDVTSSVFNSTAPTSTHFTVNASSPEVNNVGHKFLALLFGNVPGICKIGGYTGTGGNINIDCGFTSSARFVMIKRRDAGAGGAWHVFNTALGIQNTSEYHMYLNSSTLAILEDNIDPYSSGFTVASTATVNVNASGGEYLYMAIA